MILDGRALAAKILARVKEHALALPHSPRVVAIVANQTPATQSYLAIKEKRAIDAGCVLEVVQLPADSSTAELRTAVLSATADAVIVQLPLPSGVDTRSVCDAIAIEKDADVLSSSAREKFERGDAGAHLPPVVSAIKEIFDAYHLDLRGKRAVVVGAGFLVGAPTAVWLRQQGATVEVVSTPSDFLAGARATLAPADIVVSGTGSPHLIKPGMTKEGAVLIDAGTADLGGHIVGDIDPACATTASLFTPVPGGVGPLAVACLFSNVVSLAEKAMKN